MLLFDAARSVRNRLLIHIVRVASDHCSRSRDAVAQDNLVDVASDTCCRRRRQLPGLAVLTLSSWRERYEGQEKIQLDKGEISYLLMWWPQRRGWRCVVKDSHACARLVAERPPCHYMTVCSVIPILLDSSWWMLQRLCRIGEKTFFDGA